MTKTYFGGDNSNEADALARIKEDHEQHVLQRQLYRLVKEQLVRTEFGDFMRWWTGSLELSKCHLSQALRSYLQSFPARSLPLIHELIEAKANEPS